MAWNPSPEVATARDYGKKFGCNRVIILYTTPGGGCGYTSYGWDKRLCAQTQKIADSIFDDFVQNAADARDGALK